MNQEHKPGASASPESGAETQDAPNQELTAHLSKRWVIGFAIVVIAAAAVTFALMGRAKSGGEAGKPVPEPSAGAGTLTSAPGGTAPRPGDIVITLSRDQIENAHIQTEAAAEQPGGRGSGAGALRTTGSVQSNAYKEVPVSSIAGGIVRQVNVELGDTVSRGEQLATIFSTELSDAQAVYIKMQADIERHHQHYRRTLELVELGAASREELETATAEYKTEQANLSQMKQRLILLGMTDKQVENLGNVEQVKALVLVTSPSSGIVVTRSVNPGEVVMAGKELLRVADLSTVWVIGQVYEQDFGRLQVGTAAVITSQAYPGRNFKGQVSYIDPKVDPQTRTAQARIEVANPGEMLRLGMFVDVSLGDGGSAPAKGPVIAVPASAVQTIGSRRVVFIAGDQPGVFIQREVNVGPVIDAKALVFRGLMAGERVVTDGSFLLRSESLKVKPDQVSKSGAAPEEQRERAPSPASTEPGEVTTQARLVSVTEKGFEPDTVRLRVGIPARVTFLRKVEVTCSTEVLIPEYKIKRELPFNEPVVVEFTPTKRGEFPFTCGMKMQRGKLIVR